MTNERVYVGSAFLVAAIIGMTFFVSVFIPASVNGEEVFVRTSTVTETQTAYLSTVVTSTYTQRETSTVVSVQTIPAPLPATVAVSGTATTKGPGTTPTTITFSSQGGNTVGQITQGRFNVTLANPGNYAVKIEYSAIPTGGECFVAELILSTSSPSISAAFTC